MEVSSMRGSVLIVHDDVELRRGLGAVLGANGFRVLSAATGQEALAVLEEDVPSLLVIGVGMPLLSGWKLVEALAHYPDLSRIPRLLVGPELSAAEVVSRALATLAEKPASAAADILLEDGVPGRRAANA
jgi:CheY-like chemotaxis protein